VAQDRLLVVWKTVPGRGFENMPFSWPAVEELRARLRTVSGVAAHPYHGAGRAVVRRGEDAQMLQLTGVTGDWFGVLGVRPVAGRLIAPADDRVGAARVLVLSAGAAQRLFGSARAALGATLRVDEHAYTVVGVAHDDLAFPRGAQAWTAAAPLYTTTPQPAASLREATQLAWNLVVRVAPGATVEQTRAELAAALASLTTESAWLGEQRIHAPLLADVVTGEVRPALLLLGVAVLLVLAVAGVNVANLLLGRGLARRRELAVRSALGASRARLLRQLATEAVVLVAAGALLAVFVAHASLALLLALAPAELPRLAQVGIDGRALTFTGGVAAAVAVLFGVLPAAGTARRQGATLRVRDGAGEPGTRAHWLRHGLVVAQVALTALVLSTAGQLLRSVERMQRLDVGFEAEEVVLAEIAIPLARYAAESEHQQAMVRLAERAADLAGVAGASALLAQPFAGSGGFDAVWYAEGSGRDQAGNPYSNYEGADASHFATMRLPVLRGRGIEATDRADSRRVVVVNETFARLYWPGEDPVGRRIKLGTADSGDEWRTVVGVVADTRYRELTAVRPGVYVPYGQGIPVRPRYLALRTALPPAVAPAIRRLVAEQEPTAAIVGMTPLSRLLEAPLARPRFQSALGAAFALLGLVLSAVGTYSVLAFFVRQRTREIGIRMALGAQPANVRALVLRQGVAIGGLGIVLGTAGAVAAGRLIETHVFGVRALDPLVLGATAAVLLAACTLAAAVPTRLATRADPLLVLRSE
jgi:putative ABC transport system permease protein